MTMTNTTMLAQPSKIIDVATTMGAVSLSVADLARSVAYYQNNIGLAVLAQTKDTATLGAGATPLLHLREVRGAKLVRSLTLQDFPKTGVKIDETTFELSK